MRLKNYSVQKCLVEHILERENVHMSATTVYVFRDFLLRKSITKGFIDVVALPFLTKMRAPVFVKASSHMIRGNLIGHDLNGGHLWILGNEI